MIPYQLYIEVFGFNIISHILNSNLLIFYSQLQLWQVWHQKDHSSMLVSMTLR